MVLMSVPVYPILQAAVYKMFSENRGPTATVLVIIMSETGRFLVASKYVRFSVLL